MKKQVKKETFEQREYSNLSFLYANNDILEGENISKSTLDINDDEDRFMGKTNNLQYSLDGGNTWLDYTSETTFEGTMKVKVRYKAHGVYLAGDFMEFDFS